MLKILYISIFLLASAFEEHFSTSEAYDCNAMELKGIKSIQDDGSKVEIAVTGGQSPYKYIFYKESGHLLSLDFDSNTVSKLQKGKYYCTVADRNNCKKTIEIEIN